MSNELTTIHELANEINCTGSSVTKTALSLGLNIYALPNNWYATQWTPRATVLWNNEEQINELVFHPSVFKQINSIPFPVQTPIKLTRNTIFPLTFAAETQVHSLPDNRVGFDYDFDEKILWLELCSLNNPDEPLEVKLSAENTAVETCNVEAIKAAIEAAYPNEHIEISHTERSKLLRTIAVMALAIVKASNKYNKSDEEPNVKAICDLAIGEIKNLAKHKELDKYSLGHSKIEDRIREGFKLLKGEKF